MGIFGEKRNRILSLFYGTAEPSTGMEKHFVRVCRGEARPITHEEREWYRFVQSVDPVGAGILKEEQGNQGSQEEESRDSDQVKWSRKTSVEAAPYAPAPKRPQKKTRKEKSDAKEREQHYLEELVRLESIIEKQQSLIHALRRAAEKERRKVASTDEKDVDGGWSICKACNGDGGARGECYKCGGTGWIEP